MNKLLLVLAMCSLPAICNARELYALPGGDTPTVKQRVGVAIKVGQYWDAVSVGKLDKARPILYFGGQLSFRLSTDGKVKATADIKKAVEFDIVRGEWALVYSF